MRNKSFTVYCTRIEASIWISKEQYNGIQEVMQSQLSHELRSFKNSKGCKKVDYLYNNYELVSIVTSPLDWRKK